MRASVKRRLAEWGRYPLNCVPLKVIISFRESHSFWGGKDPQPQKFDFLKLPYQHLGSYSFWGVGKHVVFGAKIIDFMRRRIRIKKIYQELPWGVRARIGNNFWARAPKTKTIYTNWAHYFVFPMASGSIKNHPWVYMWATGNGWE